MIGRDGRTPGGGRMIGRDDRGRAPGGGRMTGRDERGRAPGGGRMMGRDDCGRAPGGGRMTWRCLWRMRCCCFFMLAERKSLRLLFLTRFREDLRQMRFTSKAEALRQLPRTGYLVCRDTDTRRPDGSYTGGKVFCACPTLESLIQLARCTPHMYEHVGHWEDQKLAPYLDVELLLRLPLTRARDEVLELYRSAILRVLAPYVRLVPEQVHLATAIAEVRTHLTPDGHVVKCKAPPQEADGRALLFSFHVKVAAPGVYFCGNAQQKHFWEKHAPQLSAMVGPILTPLLAGPPPPALFGHGWFDPLVYNERPWRMLYSAKISNAARILCPWPSGDATWDAQQLVAHLVTHVPGDQPSVLPHAVLPPSKRQGLLASVTASMPLPYQRLLLPYRLAQHVANKQKVATHHWPPNAAAIYFQVPPDKWPALESLLWTTEGALLAYCYAERPHALQLDIDKCPEDLRGVTLCCHAALQQLGVLEAASPVAVEQSPPKPGAPDCVYGRLTFPTLVVDDTGSLLLKLCCAQACSKRFPDATLAQWTDVIDLQSRGSRTHHSSKVGPVLRQSRPVGLWDGAGGELPLDQAAFCPLRPDGTPTVALSGIQRMTLEKIHRALPQRVGTAHFRTVMLQGRNVRFSSPTNDQLQERAQALWDLAQQTLHFQRHPFVLTYIYQHISSGKLPEYRCYTDCLHCPFRAKERVPGHGEGSLHTDHHLLLVVTAIGVELRCNAKWHQRKTTQSVQQEVESSWREHYALLFGRHVQPPPPKDAVPFISPPTSTVRFLQLRSQLLA